MDALIQQSVVKHLTRRVRRDISRRVHNTMNQLSPFGYSRETVMPTLAMPSEFPKGSHGPKKGEIPGCTCDSVGFPDLNLHLQQDIKG
jgi:hypothetical protein